MIRHMTDVVLELDSPLSYSDHKTDIKCRYHLSPPAEAPGGDTRTRALRMTLHGSLIYGVVGQLTMEPQNLETSGFGGLERTQHVRAGTWKVIRLLCIFKRPDKGLDSRWDGWRDSGREIGGLRLSMDLSLQIASAQILAQKLEADPDILTSIRTWTSLFLCTRLRCIIEMKGLDSRLAPALFTDRAARLVPK